MPALRAHVSRPAAREPAKPAKSLAAARRDVDAAPTGEWRAQM